jgi:hypothetical protein
MMALIQENFKLNLSLSITNKKPPDKPQGACARSRVCICGVQKAGANKNSSVQRDVIMFPKCDGEKNQLGSRYI